MQDFLKLIEELRQAASNITIEHFRKPFEVISKEDESPVTIADKAIEQRLREIIEQKRPQDGILGEEFGTKKSENGLMWVVDPIDGTKSFVIGRPTFGTLIALCEEDKPVLGAIVQPILNETWVGGHNHPTTLNGNPVKTRPCKSLSEACTASTTPEMFHDGHEDIMHALEKDTKMIAWGGDCYTYGLLASGFMDLCVENLLSPYDFAALVPVIENAGGIVTDWEGKPLTLKSGGTIIACGDLDLHLQVLEMMKT